ncbi:hypothetical protein AC578_2962 [Pseudocercospora eumusae]|uniref:Uncharacterized protein n=1 Tax=Pseudocercospora eumusae TaxID=321146 RepID=A0A139HEA5_9PEZI|nr:hypothetical protein AC578_2962 [Pseudocercospora eumusae]
MPIMNAASGPNLNQLSGMAPTSESADPSTRSFSDSTVTSSSPAASMSASGSHLNQLSGMAPTSESADPSTRSFSDSTVTSSSPAAAAMSASGSHLNQLSSMAPTSESADPSSGSFSDLTTTTTTSSSPTAAMSASDSYPYQPSSMAPTTESADPPTALLSDSTITSSSPAAAMSASDAQKPGFLDIAAELRIQIYEYALIDECPIWVRKDHTDRWESRAVFRTRDRRDPYGCRSPSFNVHLLRANRQVHREASSIFYGKNAFLVGWDDPCGPFTESTIRHVRILRLYFDNIEVQFVRPMKKDFRKGLARLVSWAGVLKLGALQLVFTNSFQKPSLREVNADMVAREFRDLVMAMMKSRGMERTDAVKMVEFVPSYHGNEIVEAVEGATVVVNDALSRNTQFRDCLLKLIEEKLESGLRAGVGSRRRVLT